MASPATLRVEELDSGTTYGYILPAISRMLLSGYFPAPLKSIAQKFLSGKIDADKLMEESEIEAWESFRSHLVAWMVRTVDGEPVDLKPIEVDDPEQFPFDDREALYLRAIRVVSSPKAEKAT